jgi:hypothetical protein
VFIRKNHLSSGVNCNFPDNLNRKFFCILILLFSFQSNLFAQDAVSLTLNGHVYDEQYPELYLENIMVINLRTQQGIFAEGNNTFSLKIMRNDTVVIAAGGYAIKKICYKDSLYNTVFSSDIPLTRLSVQLKEISIFQQRDWKAIESDLQSLGYKESDYRIEGLDALNSPVTAIYEAFSKRERSRRKVAELKNEDMRKALLKEIIRIYIRTGLIELNEEDADDFIEHLQLSEQALKNLTQYELALFIKDRFRYYNPPGK